MADFNIFGAKPSSNLEELYKMGLLGNQNDGSNFQDFTRKANRQSNIQGLLTGALSYLAQPKNQNFGSVLPYLARAGLQGVQAAGSSMDRYEQDAMRKLKFQEQQRVLAQQESTEKLKERYRNDPRVLADPILQAALEVDPAKALEILSKQPTRPNNAQRYSDLLTMQKQSKIPNSGVVFSKGQEAELNSLAKTLKITNPVAPTVNKLLDMGYKKIDRMQPFVDDAPRNITRYQKFKQAIEADETFMGLQTDLKTNAARIASFFGVGGADLNEKLANTKEIVQQMANRQLDAGKKLKGMPSDKEQALLQKAAGANYDNMTPGELLRVIELAIEDEEHIIKNYNGTLDIVSKAEATNSNNSKESLSILDSFRVTSPNKTVVVDY